VTCDVIVPHTRTVSDMLKILDVLTLEDEVTEGDFWRDQPFVELPKPSTLRPKTYQAFADSQSLKGKVVGVPRMYIGENEPDARPVCTRQSVIDLWKQAKADLEGLGAEVKEVDFPVVANYERHSANTTHNIPGAPTNWAEAERGIVIAYSWDDFLRQNRDPAIPDAWAVNAARIFPRSLEEIQWKWSEMSNLVGYDTLFNVLSNRGNKSIFEIAGFKEACLALEATRKRDLEEWMDVNKLDAVVFPANGDVGRADADTNDESAKYAWKNGVKYSNGNRALRHLGIPSVTVTMGTMEDTRMPVGLTFVSKAYDDHNLLRYAYAYEQKSGRRRAPPLTPPLDTDEINPGSSQQKANSVDSDAKPVELTLTGERKAGRNADEVTVQLSGTASAADDSGIDSLTVYVDGKQGNIHVNSDGTWTFTAETRIPQVSNHVKTEALVARDQVMAVVVAKSGARIHSGKLLLL
jgi:Asp-tRNA(Asn)/Glu-tRNA(Gln) amidotransferase A subunit family amidase